MITPHEGALLIFAKAPLPGQAKTRLIPALGEKGAAGLQQYLLNSTLATVGSQPCGVFQLWCTPDTGHPAFIDGAARYPLQLYQQQGDDLGARMAHAFECALAEYSWALIIGTDCPGLTTDDLLHSAELLRQGADAVLGPAADGGYYLLGLRRFEPSLFNDMVWGGDGVLAETRRRLQQLGMNTRLLEVKHDLDRPEDLRHFPDLRFTSTTGPYE